MPREAMQKPRLQEKFESDISNNLTKEFDYQNVFQVPKLIKIVLNMGVGRQAVENKKAAEGVAEDLALITGQKAKVTLAKKSISNFKIREGMPIGAKVTLRRNKMYEFFDRFVNIALPRVRDFQGLSAKSFDGRGNYSIGIKEHIIFPEIDFDKTDQIRGVDITICTSAKSTKETKALLSAMGLPFVDNIGDK